MWILEPFKSRHPLHVADEVYRRIENSRIADSTPGCSTWGHMLDLKNERWFSCVDTILRLKRLDLLANHSFGDARLGDWRNEEHSECERDRPGIIP